MMPEGFTLGRYQPEDRSHLRRFLTTLEAGHRGWADHLLECATATNTTTVVAKFEDAIVAYGEFHRSGLRSVYFHRAAVLKPYRRQHLFTAIMDEIIRRSGGSAVTAEVSRDARHLRVMQSRGFGIAGELDGFRYLLRRPAWPFILLPQHQITPVDRNVR